MTQLSARLSRVIANAEEFITEQQLSSTDALTRIEMALGDARQVQTELLERLAKWNEFVQRRNAAISSIDHIRSTMEHIKSIKGLRPMADVEKDVETIWVCAFLSLLLHLLCYLI